MKIITWPSKKEIFIGRDGPNISVEVYYWAIHASGVEYISSAYTYESNMADLFIYLKDFSVAEKLRIRRELLLNDLVFLTVKL